MSVGNLKFGTAESQQPQRTSRRVRPMVATGREIPAEGVLAEETFRAMLLLERRRAERSRNPFVLMLVNMPISVATSETEGFRVARAVSTTVRESDLVGWYDGRQVLGVIFTEINLDVKHSIIEILKPKVLKALQENVDSSIASKLSVTFHLFPENFGDSNSDRTADIKLYPDLHDEPAKKTASMAIKRVIDIAGSAMLLIVLAPLLAAIAVAIKLTSKGPVIFRQERLGQFGHRFRLLKFRTMRVNNDPGIHRDYVRKFIAGAAEQQPTSGPTIYKIKSDPRVTTVGKFLRKTSLDELPQFWNVLRGEMSLVGPRPPVAYEFEVYDFWHRRRVLEVKPGVTGLWQVSGRSRTCFDDMVRLDLRYSQQWSLWLDLKILMATPLAVLIGDGAF